MKKEPNPNNLVSYSRAGDIFHYRWAARRCLKLIQPTSNLQMVFIEGSNEEKKAGEYVIDVAEYYYDINTNQRIKYFQLKHTTVRQGTPFTLSDLKGTLVGFSKRYQQHSDENSLNEISFTIITNRRINEYFKQNINAIVNGGESNKSFLHTLKKYTKLDGKALIQFCSLLNFEDSEADYNVQEEDLRVEMSRLQPGSIDPAQVDSIVSLVQKKVLPDSNGKIIKEDILRPFGVTSLEQLFPAPPLFEATDNIIFREQYRSLLRTISNAKRPVIIQSEGGVGKSVFSQYVIRALPEGSLGIAYDCFGSGKYRSKSKPRHRHRDALVQLANQLASMGLCERMLIKDTTQENDIMRGFLNRVETSLLALKQVIESAMLFILIDAADNAEMAAHEFGDSCFANDLLREEFPMDCKVILLCRPERTHLLKPPGYISLLNLQSFSKEETYENLKKWFPKVSDSEALEFHRLTNGNPRVQMNSIAAKHSSVKELLAYLGPSGTTVERQIEQHLNIAVQKIKDVVPDNYQTAVEKICTGLASLPPNIPILVLSQAAGVKVEDVKSFVADIGRSLWLLDSSVQFRDEPTETWFRKTYLGSKTDFSSYIHTLEPLAGDFTYVAEILPQLYLQAGQYDKLISVALSDELLPLNNPIDTRNVLVYRLQFAFKAALRAKKYKDAIKLALRAGEEVAGDQRQLSLFQNNIDLLPKLQNKLKVQEIAFKGLLRSGWEGSENLYTASLLSEIEEFKGEANSYLRSALNWLHIYFEEAKRSKDRKSMDGVSFDDILEVAICLLNLNGVKSSLKFLNSLKPKESIFQVMKRLIIRLIDAGRFNEIDEILKNVKGNKFHVVAIASELEKVGRFVKADYIEKCLSLLLNPKTRINKPKDPFNDTITPSIVAFLEVCLHQKMNTNIILEVLDYYVPNVASHGIGSRFDSNERLLFLKATAIRSIITKESVANLVGLMPDEYKSNNNKRNYSNEIQEFKEVIGSLLPWFLLRAQVISGNIKDLTQRAEQANKDSRKANASRYRSYDILPNEIADVSTSILVYCNQQETNVVHQYYDDYIRDNPSFKIPQRCSLLRTGTKASHLNTILAELENSTYELIKGLKDGTPEEIADQYISLARAVLSGSKHDAAVYFEDAINIVSKFGDEIVDRWEAVAALGEKAAEMSSNELAYRFIRCAELVGENAREKHWDRSGALVTCTKMSPQIGISALSRWRDREVGRFELQLESMLNYLIRSKAINPVEGWSMARFFSDHHLNELLSTCLANETSEKLRKDIIEDACELLSKEGANADYWMNLKKNADTNQLTIEYLEKIVEFYKDIANEPKTLSKDVHKVVKTEAEVKKWDQVFYDVNFLKPEGFATLLDRFLREFIKENQHSHWRSIDLFKEVLKRIEASEIHNFIDLLFTSEKVSYYDCQQVLSSIPDTWKSKASFKKKWPAIIYHLGTRYAHELVNDYPFRSIVRDLLLDDSLTYKLREGIFQGLSLGLKFSDARMLFNFIQHASTFIYPSDACELTDYALSRFELHIDEDFGDGLWDEWLHVSNDIMRNIAGFIWSALGSPRSSTRWNACHVIKKLADYNCTQVLDLLIEWLEHNEVDAFGSKHFHFYNLHARQYLLIALCRASADYPALLVRYKNIFFKYAQFEPHILIQKFSAEIALNIEKAIPGTYSSSEASSLSGIGKSKQKIKKGKYGYQVDSYLHKIGHVDTTLDFHFGWDFDRYWYEPLGKVFGISGDQIEDLCANVIAKEWKLSLKTGYNNDPRVSLWNRSQERETWHDHGSYPKTDNWDFYLSYHSMLNVASKLVENMPVINTRDRDEEDVWGSWLSRHLLTRADSKWLADCRGPLPLQRPEWLVNDGYEHWRTDIHDQDFIKCIKNQRGKETWLNIKGRWTERHNTRYERYSVSTALVSKETSNALLRLLSTRSNYHYDEIPDYKESGAEIDSGGFRLEGFIQNHDSARGIDQLDPFSCNIIYPPFSLGEPFLKALDLSSNNEGNTWYFSNGEVALKSETWSGNRQGFDEEPEQSGIRLSASLLLLKRLCQVYDCHLIIDVNISRDIEYKYRSDDKYEYRTHHKFYLFSENGKLKSSTENYRLRSDYRK